jgi:2-desacetyl-2-hydroxyethyl bacteriochlorophyllide A dehydrogenase
MLALQKTEAGAGVALVDVPEPAPPGPGELLLEVAATGICGSDLSIEKWSPMYDAFMAAKLPVTLGHETAGRVVAVGEGVAHPAIGDRVVINPAVACGRCPECLAGDPVACTDRQAVGMVRDGAFARLVTVPAAYAFRLPDNVPIELGALVEPLSVGTHALITGGMAPGKSVIVYGPGPIGQGVAAMARHMGAPRVTVVGMNDGPRFDVLRRMGFTSFIDMADADAPRQLAEAAGGGFDIAVEATGVSSVIDAALGTLRQEGVLAIAGMTEKPAQFDVLRLVRHRLQIRGVSRIPPLVYPVVLNALAANPDFFAPLVTHRMPLSQAADAFRLARAGEASKVLLIPE